VLLRFAPRLLPLCLTTVGTLLVAALLAGVGSAPASAQDEAAAPGPSYGGVSSAVVPQPDGAPSIFIQANGIVYNSWYANGGWPRYPIAFYTTSPPANSVTSGFATSRAVAVLQPDGSPSIFFQGVGGSLWNYWYVSGAWDSAEIASTGVESTPVAILQPNGSPSVFFVGPDNSLRNYWYIPSQGTWGLGIVAGAGSAFGAPAAATSPPYSIGEPEVFVEGPDHSLIGYFYYLGSWQSEVIAGNGSVYSSPAVVLQPDEQDYLSLFFVGPNDSLINYWASENTMTACLSCYPAPAQFSSARVAGAGLAFSSPVVTLQPDGAPSVFVLGPSGSVLNYFYSMSQPGWGSGTVEPPGSTTSQLFGVLLQSDGAPQVFSAHQDGSLWYSSYAQGSWNNVEWGVNDAPVETYTDPQ